MDSVQPEALRSVLTKRGVFFKNAIVVTAPLFPSWVGSRRPLPPTRHASQPRRAVSDPRREAPFSKSQLLIKSGMQDRPSVARSVLHVSHGVHARWSVLEHQFNCSGKQNQRATVAGGGRKVPGTETWTRLKHQIKNPKDVKRAADMAAGGGRSYRIDIKANYGGI